MALVSLTDLTSLAITSSTAVHSFGPTGDLIVNPVATTIKHYDDEGQLDGIVTHAAFTNLVPTTAGPITTYQNLQGGPVNRGQAKGVDVVGWTAAGSGGSNRSVSKTHSGVVGERTHLHFIAKVDGVDEPVVGVGDEPEADFGVIISENRRAKVVYKKKLGDGWWYYIATDTNVTSLIKNGIWQYPNQARKPMSCAILQITQGWGWAPVIGVTTGSTASFGRRIYFAPGANRNDGALSGNLDVRYGFTPFEQANAVTYPLSINFNQYYNYIRFGINREDETHLHRAHQGYRPSTSVSSMTSFGNMGITNYGEKVEYDLRITTAKTYCRLNEEYQVQDNPQLQQENFCDRNRICIGSDPNNSNPYTTNAVYHYLEVKRNGTD